MEKTTAYVDPGVLPSFLRDVEIVGPAHRELPKYRSVYSNLAVSSTPQHGEISMDKIPLLLTDKKVRDVYQHNDFAQLKALEKAAQKDLQAVYENVSRNGEKAWTKVRKDGKEFYLSWSQSGCMWAYPEKTSVGGGVNGETQQAVIQIGTYSKSTNILGIHSYNLTLSAILIESSIALIVALAVSRIIAQGLGFAVAALSLYLCEAAAAIGLESFSFAISAAALANLAVALVFAIVFIGLTYLWNWLNRKYTIRLQIFNWDDKNSWESAGYYFSNAKICGGDQEEPFTLPKMIKPDETVLPPGFDPVEVMDSVCYYAVIVWENDNTFMEGCSMAMGIRKNPGEGFMWAFDCPRFSDNRQAADNGLTDPADYRSHCRWNLHPLGFEIRSTSSGIPVSFSVDALSGASDGLYSVNIQINQSFR